jgi:very-short-patch-repair endonuclease
MPRLAGPDPQLPVVFTAAQARLAGLTPDQIRQRVRSGRWVALNRGVYRRAEATIPDDLDAFAGARVDHAQRAVAMALANAGCVIGFHSATAVHGLPLFEALPERVALIAPEDGWNGQRPGVVIHRTELADDDVVHLRVPVTSIARTWFDIARHHSLADSLALGDAALRRGDVSRNDLLRVMAHSVARRGTRRARVAAGHLDAARESVLESASWAYFVEHGLPLPRLQVELRTDGGRFVARVDVLWDQARLVGECDGRLKYAVADDLYREKRREDEIRALGYGVIRWGMADLRSPALAARIRRLLT